MKSFVIPHQSFFPDSPIHLPESFRGPLIRHRLKFVYHISVIAMTLIVINGSRKIHQFAGPTQTYLIPLLNVINVYPLLGGP